jgi:hypothetical protein
VLLFLFFVVFCFFFFVSFLPPGTVFGHARRDMRVKVYFLYSMLSRSGLSKAQPVQLSLESSIMLSLIELPSTNCENELTVTSAPSGMVQVGLGSVGAFQLVVTSILVRATNWSCNWNRLVQAERRREARTTTTRKNVFFIF